MSSRLDMGKVLYGAFVLPWRERSVFSRRLGLPLMALVALSLLWSNFPSEWPRWIGWVSAFVYWAVFAGFAVIVHRLILLPDADRRSSALPRWTRREVRFVVALLGVGALMAVVGAAVVFVPGTILANLSLDSAVGLLPELARLPGMYVLGRLCLVFPAIALDRRVDLMWSWRITKGHGARLFILVGLLPWVIAELGSLLFRSDAGLVESLLLTLVLSALYVAEIAVVSLCYRELVPTAPSDPA